MRTFIAISLPKEIKELLSRLQEKLKASQADVKWVSPENIHLTLKFLGEIDDKELNKVSGILEDITKDKNSFYMRIASVGAFPKTNSPRVIWVGIDKGDEETKEIARELEEKITPLGIPKEDRPFTSHLTIGRTKSSLNRESLVQLLKSTARDFGSHPLEFPVTKLTLFQSILTPKGPIYERLKEVNLKTS